MRGDLMCQAPDTPGDASVERLALSSRIHCGGARSMAPSKVIGAYVCISRDVFRRAQLWANSKNETELRASRFLRRCLVSPGGPVPA